jgi:hypothetical protein
MFMAGNKQFTLLHSGQLIITMTLAAFKSSTLKNMSCANFYTVTM